jgi:hypothetical protein
MLAVLAIDVLCCLALYQIDRIAVLLNGIILMLLSILMLLVVLIVTIIDKIKQCSQPTYNQKKDEDRLDEFDATHSTSILLKKHNKYIIWIWSFVNWIDICKRKITNASTYCTNNQSPKDDKPHYHNQPPKDEE